MTKAEDKVETESKLAYTTSTGETPVSKLAKVTTKTADPALKPPPRIAKKATKKRTFSRVSAPAVTHTDIKVDPRVLTEAKKIVDQGTYTRIEFIDNETVVVR